MLNRYFQVIDKLYLVIRTIHIDKTYQEAHLDKLELFSVEVIEIQNLNTPLNFIRKGKYIRLLDNLLSRIDLVFLRIPSIISNMVASRCERTNKPYLVEVGGCAWDSYYNHSLMGKIIAPYMYFSQKHTVRNASFASYVTSKWLQSRYPAPCEQIIASNVYLSDFNEDVIKKRITSYKTRFRTIKTIGTIASVEVRYKGQEYIIKALSELKKKGYYLEYQLVGAGNPAFLTSLAKKYNVLDQVKFLGIKLHHEIWDWLDSIDIYAQPSKQEGLPRAVIEAMNRGCLTIGSTTAGIPELLEDDMVFKCASVDDIVVIIEKLVTEKDHTERILRNFNRSKEYDINLLNDRRNRLFQEYKDSIK